jgi:hypothetical protein
MPYTYNPLLKVGLDQTGAGGGTPGGADTQIQYNDNGSLAGSADLAWDDSGKVLDVGGDINLDDGGSFQTTLQLVTPTANRTVTFPDATGTVALVAGSSGQAIYNDAGAYSGLSTVTTDGTNVTLTGRFIGSLNGAASAPPATLTGTWFTGGTATTTKPQLLLEPAGTTSTAWSTAGTGLGVNAASGFAGRLLDAQVNGTSRMVVTGAGSLGLGTSSPASALDVRGALYAGVTSTTGQEQVRFNTQNTYAGQIYTNNLENFWLLGGAIYNGTNFVANTGTATAAMRFIQGTVRFETNSGLTPSTSYTPTERLRIDSLGNVGIGTTSPSSLLHLADAGNITVGTTTGTKIGTATTQKLGFFNATPVVQPTAVADSVDTTDIVAQFNALLSRMRDLGLIAT